MRTSHRILVLLAGLLFALGLAPVAVADAAPRADVGGGSAIVVNGEAACTMTTVGRDGSGSLMGLTAGHCGEIGARVTLERNRGAGEIGRFVAVNERADYAVIRLDATKVNPVRRVGPATISGVAKLPTPFNNVCKSGRTTGFTCGPVLHVNRAESISYVCAAPGDSGGPIVAGNRIVGMLNGGLIFDLPGGAGLVIECRNPNFPIFSPMVATSFTDIQREINRIGGPGAGFRPI